MISSTHPARRSSVNRLPTLSIREVNSILPPDISESQTISKLGFERWIGDPVFVDLILGPRENNVYREDDNETEYRSKDARIAL